MKKLILVSMTLLSLLSVSGKADDNFAVHPTPPPQPKYLPASDYEQLKKALPPAPKQGSKEQAADEKVLRDYQKNRTEKDCQRANGEVKFSFQSYFAAPDGPLTKEEEQKIEPLLSSVFSDMLYFVDKLKLEYPRERPYVYLKDIKPCVPLERTKAYPSGHTAISVVLAMIAGDLFPNKAAALKKRAEQIAQDRIVGGVHHPTDVEAGKKIARELYPLFEKSAAFQADLKKVKETLH